MAQYLHYNIPGVTVPSHILNRFEEAREDDYEEVGIEIGLEIIEKIKSKQGINGIHLMSVGWEAIVPRIINEAGLN
jgi:5,10-methylenetetrahydrofolate reductase